MVNVRELVEKLNEMIVNTDSFSDKEVLRATVTELQRLKHIEFQIGETLVRESKWEFSPEKAVERIRGVLHKYSK